MDAVLGFIGGLFCGGILGFVVAMLIASGNNKESVDDGVDDVMEELFKTVQEQPYPHHDEERQEELNWKHRE